MQQKSALLPSLKSKMPFTLFPPCRAAATVGQMSTCQSGIEPVLLPIYYIKLQRKERRVVQIILRTRLSYPTKRGNVAASDAIEPYKNFAYRLVFK